MMYFDVDSGIVIHNPTNEVKSWCKNNLVLDNPDYYKKKQLGKWTGNTPKSIYLYEKNGEDLIVPFGCLKELWTKTKDEDPAWNIKISPLREFDYGSNIKLYPYQERAVKEVLRAKNGVLVMPCGSGKTQSGLEAVSRIGGRALWLTHTQDLLNQSKKRAEVVLRNVGVGTITEGKVNIGEGITFATVQTMCKLDLSKYKTRWDVIIVDECQHCAGSPTKVTQFYKVMSNLEARYKIGLTATPKRADGLERSMFALLGDIIHEISREEVENTTCPVRIRIEETGWIPDLDKVLLGDGTIDYNKVVEDMIHNEDRFNCVFGVISNLPKCEPIMVLANRVEYLQKLCYEYNLNEIGNGVCISGAGHSKAAKEERKKALERLNSGEIDCIFATYQLAKEGLDVPNLKYVIFATPEKDETTVIQSVGRVGRKADGKEYGLVIDFVDSFGMYAGWAKKRVRYYRKVKADLEVEE